MLTGHGRTVLRRLAVEIAARDPALAHQLSSPSPGRAIRFVRRAVLLVSAVAVAPLLVTGLLVGGLDEHIQALTVLGAITICAAIPVSGWLAHHINRRVLA